MREEPRFLRAILVKGDLPKAAAAREKWAAGTAGLLHSKFPTTRWPAEPVVSIVWYMKRPRLRGPLADLLLAAVALQRLADRMRWSDPSIGGLSIFPTTGPARAELTVRH